MLRVTFGLLLSTDHGKNFDWVCEQSIGYSGVEDPMYAATPSGNLLATTFQGISFSTDKACNWTASQTQSVFIDLASNPANGKDIVAFSSSYKNEDDAGNLHYTSTVWESQDEGKTFAQIGSNLDDTLIGYTIDFTTTDPNRLYITAVRNPGPTGVGVLLTSEDHGTTWSELDIPLVGTERSLFIAAVDPFDADKVYIRTNANPDKPARLLLREKGANGDAGADAGADGGVDGGASTATVRTLFNSVAPLEGFALSADASKVYVGSTYDGVWAASTSDYQFTQKSQLQAQCLGITADGLYACSNEGAGFILGLSKDDGATFTPTLHFCGIRGPLGCDNSSATTQQCAPIWAAQQDTLGCGGNANDGGQSSSGSLSSSSSSGSPSLFVPKSSCTCDVIGPPSDWASLGGALGSLVGVAVALARRARRRR